MKFAKSVAAFGALALSACSPLTAFNTLTPKDPAARIGQAIPYGDNPRQKLDIYAPRGGIKAAPVVVFFYGGGWNSGRRSDYSFAAHAIAAQGFFTVVPDYRVYPEVRYPEFLKDGAQAVRWVQDHAAEYGGDPKIIMLAGHSAGAYNAVELALDQSFLKDAGVDVARIKGVAGLAGPYDFLPLDVQESKDAFGQFPDLPQTQPVNHVFKGAPPMFLAHGTRDTVVGPYHTEHLAKALKAIGAPVEEKMYAGVDHAGLVLALSQPFRSNGPVLIDMTRFLKESASQRP
jgi:acetyl esterase/lipase